MWPGLPGKTLFPVDWSADQIMNAISEVATNPQLLWTQQGGVLGTLFTRAGDAARFFVVGAFDGVMIKVVLEPAGEGIITGFPFP